MFLRALLAIGGISLSTSGQAQPLNLICVGGGAANQATVTQGYATNSYGESAQGQVIGTRSVGFDDQVVVELNGDTGRIRMPRAMLPTIRGGKDGWFAIEKIRTTDKEITGSVQVSVLNSPKLRIDRMLGMIAINGKSGDYSGRCEPYDPTTIQRKF